MVDAIVRGEGEKTFPDLLNARKQRSDLNGIPGLIFPSPQGMRDNGDPDQAIEAVKILKKNPMLQADPVRHYKHGPRDYSDRMIFEAKDPDMALPTIPCAG